MSKVLAASAAGILTLASFSTVAQNYNVEVGAAYSMLDAPNVEGDTFSLSGEYHFNMVDTGKLPLAEAAFLRRSSNVTALFSTGTNEVDTGLGTFDIDQDVFGVGGELYNQQMYLAANVARTEVDAGGSSGRFTAYGVRVGFLPSDGLRLTLGYDDFDDVLPSAISVGVKSVRMMVGETALNLEAEVAMLDDDDDTLVLDASADYFFNRTFSAGVRIEESDADGVKTEIGVGARMFFTPTISGLVEYTTQDEDDTFLIGATARF